MPIKKSAKKYVRVSAKKALQNKKIKSLFKKALKKAKESAKEKKEDTLLVLSLAQKSLDKAAKKGVIKKNAASRRKSKLAKMLKNLK